MNHNSYRRIIELDRMIRGGRLRSAAQAARELETSRRTIERDLEGLRYGLTADVVYNREKGCYEYAGNAVTLPAQWLTEQELAIMLIAERALRIFTGTPFDRQIHPAFNKLLDPIRQDRKAMDRIRDICRRVVFFNPLTAEEDVQKKFSVLLGAISQHRRVSLEYRVVKDQAVPRQEMDPFVIMGDGARWYVIGFCRAAKQTRVYPLDTVHEPRMLDQYFDMPDGPETEKIVKSAMKGK